MSTRAGLIKVGTDLVTYLGGWAIIAKEAGLLFTPPVQVNETLIWVAATMIGVPGLRQIAEIVIRQSGTDRSPPQPQPPESSPSSSGAPPGGAR